MKRLSLLALAAILTACDITQAPDQLTDAYRDYLPESASGRYACTQYVKHPDSVLEVADSLSRWPYADSGTYQAILVRTTWTGTSSTCSTVGTNGRTPEYLVVGGVNGITRHFGRWKRAPRNPNYRPATECVDCGWGK